MTPLKQCEECEDAVATLSCEACGMVYCQACSTAQHSKGKRRAHTIKSASDSSSESAASREASLQEFPVSYVDYDTLTIGEFLGKGAFGAVKRAVMEGLDVAVKLIQEITPESTADFQQEIDLNSRLQPHPNTVKMLKAT